MKTEHLSGLIAAPFTPMHPDGSINYDIIPDYYHLLKENKNTGAFICGSTGEGVSLTFTEKKAVVQAWADCIKKEDNFKLITLVGGNCIEECIELAQHAAHAGVYAIAFTSPSYFKPASVEMLAAMCRKIAAAIPQLPFYYYHIPVLTGAHFPMIELLKAADDKIENFAGIKYTHEDFMDFLSCLRFKEGKYDMLWGRDENLLSALILGTKGGVGSTFNYAAPLYYELIDAYNSGDVEKARKLQQQSIDMIALLGKYGGIATGKAYMKLIGLDCGAFRMPVKNMNAEQFERFRKEVEQLHFSNFSSRLPAKVTM
ncbi:dihydrodipicolinate synthetase [Ilyomonas limi]|uniref:Dihydrodipicolinate synthetase n=1 Tax=Ilyomonas limi TaxID=2575867 RepID=A0A4U3L704_9BACT|nr:dihydrodipicolinate synthase family protein [Ilyomonas limi]TKK71035.1 dihydrodipicolinate synthetase [Ilyomonas limi]